MELVLHGLAVEGYWDEQVEQGGQLVAGQLRRLEQVARPREGGHPVAVEPGGGFDIPLKRATLDDE